MLTTEWGPVGTRGGYGAGWGPCACPWWKRDPVGTAWSNQVAPQPGQAQGPLIHSTPPLVPTGPWAAGRTPTRTSTRPNTLHLRTKGGKRRQESSDLAHYQKV